MHPNPPGGNTVSNFNRRHGGEFFHHRGFSSAHRPIEPGSGLLGSPGTPRARGERASPNDPHTAPPCSFHKVYAETEHVSLRWAHCDLIRGQTGERRQKRSKCFSFPNTTPNPEVRLRKPTGPGVVLKAGPRSSGPEPGRASAPVMGKDTNSGVIAMSSQVFCTIWSQLFLVGLAS